MRVGITDHAQEALGDIVYVSLPEVGDEVSAGRAVRRGRVDQERVRHLRAGDRHGRRAQRGARRAPELINSDPYGDGWLVEIERRPSDGRARTTCSTPARVRRRCDRLSRSHASTRGLSSQLPIDPALRPRLASIDPRRPTRPRLGEPRPTSTGRAATVTSPVADSDPHRVVPKETRRVLHRVWHREPRRQSLLRAVRRGAARRPVRAASRPA